MSSLSSGLLVHKYGGTSVGSTQKIKQIAHRIRSLYQKNKQNYVVVLSAMSGETNRLLKLVNEVSEAPPKKYLDLAASSGEQLSIALLGAALESLGVPTKTFLAYQLGIKTDPHHQKAKITSIKTELIHQALEKKQVCIVAGFQGVNEDLEITTLGRGGSDTTAVCLAAALQANYCEINTDVAGIYSCDPRVCSQAEVIKEVDYEVALEMAAQGSKVLHPRSVEIGAKHQVPIYVRDSFAPEEQRGTLVTQWNNNKRLEAPVVTGVASESDITKISVRDMPQQTKCLSQLFKALSDEGINVDVIVQNIILDSHVMRIGFTIKTEDKDRALALLDDLKRNHGDYESIQVDHVSELSKVTVVGLGMQTHSGVATRAFETLSKEDIQVMMISTSEIKITCVISQDQEKKAVTSLHQCFLGEGAR